MKSAELKELNYQFKTNINMKTKTLNYLRTKAFFIRRILFNCIYYFGVIGLFISWTFKLGVQDWQWWVQILIFGILINIHRDIHNFVNR